MDDVNEDDIRALLDANRRLVDAAERDEDTEPAKADVLRVIETLRTPESK